MNPEPGFRPSILLYLHLPNRLLIVKLSFGACPKYAYRRLCFDKERVGNKMFSIQ